MLRRRLATLLLAGAVALIGAPLVAGAPATATAVHPRATVTLHYDASDAGDFAGTADEAAAIWNSSVSNVDLRSGGGFDFRIHEINGGGSYAIVDGLGRGDIYIDYQQAQQYRPSRIMAHEMGHILGLPDNYNGDCGILMSGHSAGYDCQNDHPSAGEAAQVDANFAGGLAARPTAHAAYRGCFVY